MLWLNARFAGSVPLLSLALLGFHPNFLLFGDSLRGYGLGALLILVTFGAFSRLVARPDWRTAAAATLAALLSVHCLLHNSAMLLGIGTAAAAVGAVRGRWRLTVASLGIGLVAALSLLPYRGPLAAARQWDLLVTQEIGPRQILYRSLDAFSSPHRLTAWIWLVLLVAAAVMVFRGVPGDISRSKTEAESDVRLFHLLTIPAALAAQYGFFTVLSYTPRPWYFLALMALVASALDGVFNLAERSPARRRLRLAIPVLLGIVALPYTAREATVRMTNVDLVARRLTSEARLRDLVLVDKWFYGVSFNRYYRGPAAWMTLPDLADRRFHRYDLVKAQMAARDPLRRVLGAVERTLQSGHAVWWISGCEATRTEPLPLRLPPAPHAASGWSDSPYYRVWTWQAESFLQRHARLWTAIPVGLRQPVSRYECLTIRRFQQWQDPQEETGSHDPRLQEIVSIMGPYGGADPRAGSFRLLTAGPAGDARQGRSAAGSAASSVDNSAPSSSPAGDAHQDYSAGSSRRGGGQSGQTFYRGRAGGAAGAYRPLSRQRHRADPDGFDLSDRSHRGAPLAREEQAAQR
ncbi:MAG TPA: hypothetical protein VFY43_06045 [Candidatus Limnocylindria bacterium]|nr:hypothetical protein [Candidatus Limnocylindria bacterium]